MNQFLKIELNEKSLADKILQYTLKKHDTYREYMLYFNLLDPREKHGDLNSQIDFIKEKLSSLELIDSFCNSIEFTEESSNPKRYE